MTDHPTPDEPYGSFVDPGAEEPPAGDTTPNAEPRAAGVADPATDAAESPEPADAESTGLDTEDHVPPGQTAVPMADEGVVDDETMRRAIEAILMVTDEPLPVLTLARAVGRPTGDVSAALLTLADEYTEQGRGFDLREVGGGWRYYTRVEAAPYVERFVLDGQQARLTQAALETLAVVAYKQPVSRARVSAIRGVNVDGVMRTLIARGLVEEAGADTESQATLYRTTSYFLERMGMQSLDDLPELAPYLPEMDDIEEELAAQTLPPTTSEDSTTSADEPAADDTGIDGDLTTDEPVELDVDHEPGELEPSEEFGSTADDPAEEQTSGEGNDDAGADQADALPASSTGIDGDLTTDEPVDLDVAQEPGELQPSDEFGSADAARPQGAAGGSGNADPARSADPADGSTGTDGGGDAAAREGAGVGSAGDGSRDG
ncbi:SMC-Scp complex subunit ScpB [Kribbella turkmenica]|uniref:SMC-Scp complex subunit ScpB n=1 Tax=Kribbella turkmenica TaxID=2530375 RepID=UPI00269C6F23|nr:SMC-Scp complex subunit ScpB [Kribbella turkmenica]